MKKSSFILLLILLVSFLFLNYFLGNRPQTKNTTQISVSLPLSEACKDCNVVLITMTNLRYDHMSENGYPRPTTPNLDKLEKESLDFQNSFGHSSWTLPEGISIYSSLYPFQHGVMNRYDGSVLSKKTPTLIDYLKKDGYITAAFTGGFDYNTAFGLTNRFDHYEECTKGERATYPRQPGPRAGGPSGYGEMTCTVPKAINWLRDNANKKFFMHVQGFDAHCPFSQKGGLMYDPDYKGNVNFSSCLWTFGRTDPVVINGKTYYKVYADKTGISNYIYLGPQDVKHLIAIYDEAITSADSQIGILLDELKSLGIYDKTLIVFTSEHGDMFGKYGRFMRGGPIRGTFYDDVLHLPLLIKDPKLITKKIGGLTQQIDIMPTVLNLLGLKTPSGISGKSLIPLITKNIKVSDYTFAGSNFTPDALNLYFNKKTRVESVRTLDWKLTKEFVLDSNLPSESSELFNIKKDPQELKNLAGSEKSVLQDLSAKLDDWYAEVGPKDNSCEIKIENICLIKRLP